MGWGLGVRGCVVDYGLWTMGYGFFPSPTLMMSLFFSFFSVSSPHLLSCGLSCLALWSFLLSGLSFFLLLNKVKTGFFFSPFLGPFPPLPFCFDIFWCVCITYVSCLSETVVSVPACMCFCICVCLSLVLCPSPRCSSCCRLHLPISFFLLSVCTFSVFFSHPIPVGTEIIRM
jgi:hypothetical protein